MLIAGAMLKALLLSVVVTGCVAEVSEPEGSDQIDTAIQPEAPAPVVPRIAIAKAACARAGAGVDIVATIDATLPVGQAIEFDASFVALGTVTQTRVASRFACGLWHRTAITEQAGADVGCDRAAAQPETQQITVRRTIQPTVGALPASVSVDLVAVVMTAPLEGDWMKQANARITCE